MKRQGTVVGLKDNGEKKNIEGVEKEKRKLMKWLIVKVNEKEVSKEKKKKSNKHATNKGKVVVNHPPVEHLPYLHALSKKDKEM